MRPNEKILSLIAILLLACSCCGQNREQTANQATPPDRVILSSEGADTVEVTVELAITPEQHQQGLMHREYLDPLHGMLFIFPDERQRTFWMKDTPIELDMIFIRSNMQVLGCVERAEPFSTVLRYVEGKSQYVLEVAGGFCEEHGISESTIAQFKLPSIDMVKR